MKSMALLLVLIAIAVGSYMTSKNQSSQALVEDEVQTEMSSEQGL